MNKTKPLLSVIVQTCDRYNDIWNGFYKLFNKYWHNCSYPVFHVTEAKDSGQPGVHSILTGGLEWSGRLLAALDEIDSDFVLLLLEDYYLIKQVNESSLEDCISILRTNPNVACLRIFPVPGPDSDYKEMKNVGIIDKQSEYSISTQATIWRKEALQSMLKPDETVWDFEFKGSKRIQSSAYDFLSLKRSHGEGNAESGNYPYTYLCTAVYKGKWMREAIQLCKEENVILDLNYRNVESRFENFYRRRYHSLPRVLKHVLDFIRARING